MNNDTSMPYVSAEPPHPDDQLRVRAMDIIPGGSSTGSKRPAALYGAYEHHTQLPTHYVRAEGCTVIAENGRSFIDCSMALGAVAIGYGDAAVTRAVQQAAAAGNVSGLPHANEVIVAERLAEVIPCAEQVRFLRTGAEATAAAVRIARVATGRTHVLACGYFGWLDWCSEADGVPDAVTRDISAIAFGDIASLDEAVAAHGDSIAAIIIEPLVHDIAPREWLQAAREACDRLGAVLIFDEIKTAFRMRTGGIQELHRILPDLTTVGKAFANGYPLAAVVGRADVMEAATHTWISSTAAAENTGLAAALAVLDWHDRVDVSERLLVAGLGLQEGLRQAFAAFPIGVRFDGPPQMFRLVADDEHALDALVATAANHGVLLKRGAYQFPSLAHNDEVLHKVARALHTACETLHAQRR